MGSGYADNDASGAADGGEDESLDHDCPHDALVDQPIADRMPISRVRSRTAISSVLRTMRTPIRSATQAIDVDTARKRPSMLSLRSTFSLFDADKSPTASMALDTRSTSAGSSGCASLTDKKVTAPERKVTLLQIGERDNNYVAIDDRVEARDPHDLKLLSQEADSVTCVLLQGAGEVDADQRDLTFVLDGADAPLRAEHSARRSYLPPNPRQARAHRGRLQQAK